MALFFTAVLGRKVNRYQCEFYMQDTQTHTHTEAQRGKPLLDEFIQFSIHSLGLQQHVAERISFLLGEES